MSADTLFFEIPRRTPAEQCPTPTELDQDPPQLAIVAGVKIAVLGDRRTREAVGAKRMCCLSFWRGGGRCVWRVFGQMLRWLIKTSDREMLIVVILVAVFAAWGYYVYHASQAVAIRSGQPGGAISHVPKQQWMGCAIATAAMLSNRSYQQVAAHWPDLEEDHLRYPEKLCALLEAVTDRPWYLSPCWHPLPQVRDFVPPPWAVAVWIHDAAFHPQLGQWIVIQGKMVYDPGECAEYPVSSYPRRKWVVALLAQPFVPEEEARILGRKLVRSRAR